MFITFEGVEGSGKTTQIEKIKSYLVEKGFNCLVTREPGNTDIGKKIRSILLDPLNKNLVPLSELFLYAADRAQHLKEKVLPALSSGDIVICDRFFDATTVYQGYARGIDLDLINSIHDLVLQGLKPDITFLFDLNPETGLKRAWSQLDSGSRTAKESRFEEEALSFHNKVRQGYLKIAEENQDRFIIIDAGLSVEEVWGNIKSHINKALNIGNL